jgi:drug/metabolite transporter (DMT)-like permease
MFWNRGIELIGANRAGLFLNLIPVLTAIMAYIFIGETISWYHFTGLIIILGGMALFHAKHGV